MTYYEYTIRKKQSVYRFGKVQEQAARKKAQRRAYCLFLGISYYMHGDLYYNFFYTLLKNFSHAALKIIK